MEDEIEMEKMLLDINEKTEELLEAEKKLLGENKVENKELLEKLNEAKKHLYDSWNNYYRLLSLLLNQK
jgi:hypothetical protein